MPKDLPELLQKSKWTKPSKEVETWDHWWAMHQKILKPLQKTAKIINNWWSFTGKASPNLGPNVMQPLLAAHPVTKCYTIRDLLNT